jgi:hypothetical protein
MSKIFYDHLIDLEKVEKHIKKVAKTPEEKEEFYRLIDEIVHHKVLGCILEKLPNEHHEEFLTKLADRPHDEDLLQYLKTRVSVDIEDFIKQEIHLLAVELLLILEEKSRPSAS